MKIAYSRSIHTILEMRAFAFMGTIRALSGNSAACNLTVSHDGPGDETPFSDRACGIFRCNGFRRFSGSSWEALTLNRGGAHDGERKNWRNKAKLGFCVSQVILIL
jgi:hypothetical protein